MRRRAGAALGPLLIGWVVLTAQAGEPLRAEGGERLLETLETAPASVVAVVVEAERLDAHGYRGRLRVESALVGEVSPGAELPIGWEELAPSRAPRFARGDRVLVALEWLPGASIWRSRIPDSEERTRTLAPGLRGNAFLRNPYAGSVTLLSHYLALSPEERDGSQGVGQLSKLAAGGEPELAVSALTRLGRVPSLDTMLGAAGAETLVVALLRMDAPPALVDALLALVEASELESLRAPLQARVSEGVLPPPRVLAALAALDSGLSPEQGGRLLQAGVPDEHRRVAARWMRGPEAAALLSRVAREDPDPTVRGRAVVRMIELEGRDAASRAAASLYDPDPSVRAVAARSLGRLGSTAVPELRSVVMRGSTEAAQAAVAGLLLTESWEGGEALSEIAVSHPVPGIRNLARIALGKETGHRH